MAYVITKRPVDVIEHALDFTGYIPDGQKVVSAVAKAVGETDALLAIESVTVVTSQVVVRLSGGLSDSIYQVYVTATMGPIV